MGKVFFKHSLFWSNTKPILKIKLLTPWIGGAHWFLQWRWLWLDLKSIRSSMRKIHLSLRFGAIALKALLMISSYNIVSFSRIINYVYSLIFSIGSKGVCGLVCLVRFWDKNPTNSNNKFYFGLVWLYLENQIKINRFGLV